VDKLEDEVRLKDSSARLQKWFEGGHRFDLAGDETCARFKGSLLFKQWVDHFLNEYEQQFLPKRDFCPWEGVVTQKETITRWLTEDFKGYPLVQKAERMKARLKRWI
jgi:DNA helicase II / ATP-dependent DNA helicase PcrA